jgi:hypothetical protein
MRGRRGTGSADGEQASPELAETKSSGDEAIDLADAEDPGDSNCCRVGGIAPASVEIVPAPNGGGNVAA